MEIRSGVDLVFLPRFKKALQRGGENFLRRIFNEEELSHLGGESSLHLGGEIEHLAGIFAVKEAVMKALSMPVGSWHDIHVEYKSDGAPRVQMESGKWKMESCSLSISHDGGYVVAFFVALISD